MRQKSLHEMSQIAPIVLLFIGTLVAALDSETASVPTSEASCTENCQEDQQDVCEPMVLRHNVKKRSFLLFCNFTRLPEDAFYDVEVSRVSKDLSGTPDRPAWRSGGHFNITGMEVENLQPFTRYTVRTVLRTDAVIIGISNAITVETKASREAPGDSPREVYVTSPSPGSIAVAWKEPMVPNAALLEYQLILESAGKILSKVSINPEVNFHQIRNIRGSATYRISLRAKNKYGDGPAVTETIFVEKASTKKSSDEDDSPLLCVSKTSISSFNTEYLYDTPIPVKNNSLLASISCLAADRHQNFIYIVDKQKQIFRFDIQTQIISFVWQSDTEIFSLDVDWLNQQLFVLHSSSISVVRLKEENFPSTVFEMSLFVMYYGEISVDPLNGHIFLLIDGTLYSTEIPIDDHLSSFHTISETIKTLAIDPGMQSIFAATRHTLVELSYDISRSNERNLLYTTKGKGPVKEIVKDLTRHFKDFYFVVKTKYSANPVLGSLEKTRSGYHFAEHSLSSGPLQAVISMDKQRQPLPVPYRPPEDILAVCWRARCEVTWNAPVTNAGASKSAWDRWDYVLRWRGLQTPNHFSKATIVAGKLRYTINDLGFGQCYLITLAAAVSEKEGPKSRTALSCTSRLGDDARLAFFFVRDRTLILNERTSNGLLVNGSSATFDMNFIPREILSRGRDIWCSDTHGGIHHLVNREWRTMSSLPRVEIFAVEHLTGTLYFVSAIDKWIYRWREGWSNAELLLRSSRVSGLTIDASRATLYWCSEKSIHRSGLHGENLTVIYSLSEEHNDSVITNVVWNDLSDRLMFFTQTSVAAWTGQLWEFYESSGTAKRMLGIEPIRSPRRLRVIGESAFWDDLTSVHTAHFQSNLTGQLMDNVTAFHVDLITNKKDDPRPLFPCRLDGSSIRIVGNNWRKFRLEWKCKGSSPLKEKFQVSIIHGRHRIHRMTKKISTEIRSIPPHSRLNISIQPLTRWMKGRTIKTVLWSPFGAPTAPSNLRLFYRSQRNLNTSKITSEGEACWTSRSSASRPVDYFRLRLTCSTCDRKWINKSRSLQCFPFPSREDVECLEIQACSRTIGCGENTTIECAGGKRDETARIRSLSGRLKDAKNATSSAIFWSADLMFFSRQSRIYLTFISKKNVHELYTGNASIRQMGSDWTRDQLFWTEEQDDGRTVMWKSTLMDFSRNIRRLKSYSTRIRNLTIFSLDKKIQWLMPEINKSFDGNISAFQGLSFFANKYIDDDIASCRAWVKDSVTCDHPGSDQYTIMIQFREDRIVEFSENDNLCRHLKVRGNAQGHKSLRLIQRCYVARERRSFLSKATSPLRRRRQQASPYDLVILSVVTSDRRLLSIRRDSGEMVGTERHATHQECKNMEGIFLITKCGPRVISVNWTPNSPFISRAVIQIQTSDSHNWTSAALKKDPEGRWSYGKMAMIGKNSTSSSTKRSLGLSHTFDQIVPNKVYSLRIGLIKNECDKQKRCSNGSKVSHHPNRQQPQCSCLSSADVPAPPTKPNYHYIDKSMYQLNWDQPNSHGAKISNYFVYRKDNTTDWKLAEKVPDNKVLVPVEKPTDFRVEAYNAVGGSDPSPPIRIIPSQSALSARMAPVFSPVVVGLAATLFVIFIATIIGSFCWYRRKKRFDHRRSHLNQLTMQMEMRNLNGSPGPAEVNTLYANATKMEAIERLPRISRHQLEISSNKYLGAGAFGQVWEGIARGLFPDEPERSLTVAMKTLRRGATSQERDDFLQEAQLMANFNHDHIVRLLGVCLEGEPQFIILELMNKGDLKSYLRASRPSLKDSLAALSVSNLLGIIIDVAKGCGYLEEQHFVHRDIAARNCLVTYRPDGTRVTKIGDFGLARDVYRSDYYRNKRKEAMLPVRWMSPEALVDGLFSSQSDVWAYGVLCWEVMTLGQQPYAARNHSQVMRFVRAGGVLDRPSACPEQLYQLMVLCWSFSSQLRPTFVQILNSLLGFEAQTKDPYSPFSQPFYFQNYVTQDFAAGGTAGTPSSSSEDSSECTSNLLCPGVVGDDRTGDSCDLPGGSCYETPISRPYLDVKSDMVHYVNSQVVVAMPPLVERHRPLSIDASRPSTAQIMALGPPPVPQPQPSQATQMRRLHAGDVNYRSIRVEEPESSEYQTPDGAAAALRENPDESRGATAAPSSPYATPGSGYTNVRPSVISQTATLRSTASSSNGDSSMTASTGSRSSGVLPSAAAAMEMARDHSELANNNNKSSNKSNERSGLRVAQANGNVSSVSEDYATRHYDRL